MSNLKPIRTKLLRHHDELRQAIEVHSMNHQVNRQGQGGFSDEWNQCELEGMGPGAGYVVGSRFVLILKTELQMFQPGIDQGRKTILLQPHARSNHVDVESGFASSRNQLHQIAAHQRLAPGKMQVQYSQSSGLRKYPLPVCRRELVFRPFQGNRIGTIETVQRAAMSQLGNQRERRGSHLWARTTPRCSRLASNSRTSARTSVASAPSYSSSSSSTIAVTVRFPSTRARTSREGPASCSVPSGP